MSIVLHGVAAGKGIAIGHAHLITRGTTEVPQYDIDPDKLDTEVARFDNAIKATRKELEQLRSAIPENAPTELGAFISLHLMLLTDVTLSREPIDILREQKINAEWALKQQSDKLAAQFDSIDDDYLRERKQDMLQVVRRIHNNLVGQSNEINLAGNLFDDTVLIAHDLSPADTVLFKEQHITAFVTDAGGPTSHTAILGRSLDIPSVIGLHNARKLITENEIVIVDASTASSSSIPTKSSSTNTAASPANTAATSANSTKSKKLPPPRPTASTLSCSPISNPPKTSKPCTTSAQTASACSAANSSTSTATTCRPKTNNTKSMPASSKNSKAKTSPSVPSIWVSIKIRAGSAKTARPTAASTPRSA